MIAVLLDDEKSICYILVYSLTVSTLGKTASKAHFLRESLDE